MALEKVTDYFEKPALPEKVIVPVTQPPPPDPDPLKTGHVRERDILLRYMEGQAPAAIAAEKRLSLDDVQVVLRKSQVRKEIQRLSQLANDKYVEERVVSLTIEALDCVRDTMRGDNPSELRFKAAKELLAASPIIKATQSGAASEIVAGLGEAIITRLAQLESEKKAQAAAIDVTPTPAQEEPK